MDTINMWAKKSSGVADARKLASPAVDVRGVITSTDAANIQHFLDIGKRKPIIVQSPKIVIVDEANSV